MAELVCGFLMPHDPLISAITMAAPRDKMRQMIAGPALNAALVSGLSGLFNSQPKVSAQYGTGLVVDSLGMNFAMDQNIATHTNGAATATNINGAGQTGSTRASIFTTEACGST